MCRRLDAARETTWTRRVVNTSPSSLHQQSTVLPRIAQNKSHRYSPSPSRKGTLIQHLGLGQSALIGALLGQLGRCGRYPPSLLAQRLEAGAAIGVGALASTPLIRLPSSNGRLLPVQFIAL